MKVRWDRIMLAVAVVLGSAWAAFALLDRPDPVTGRLTVGSEAIVFGEPGRGGPSVSG
jgi:hypothetical protein